MARIGGAAAPGGPVASAKLYRDKARAGRPRGGVGGCIAARGGFGFDRSTAPEAPALNRSPARQQAYAFLEFRSVEEASNAMALDGVRFRDAFLKVRLKFYNSACVRRVCGPPFWTPSLNPAKYRAWKHILNPKD
jgi:hypothetical protein